MSDGHNIMWRTWPGSVVAFDPIRDTLHQELWRGTLSSWLSTQLFGASLIEQLHYAMFSPFEWLFIVAPRSLWTLIMISDLALGGLVLFALCRNLLRVSAAAALGGALVYVLAGQTAVYFDTESVSTGLVAQALILYGAIGLLVGATGGRRHVALLATGAMLALVSENLQYIVMQATYFLPVFALLSFAAGTRARWLLVAFAGLVALLSASDYIVQALPNLVNGYYYNAHDIGHFNWPVKWMWLSAITSPWMFQPLVYSPWQSVSSNIADLETFSVTFGFFGTYLALLAVIWPRVRGDEEANGLSPLLIVPSRLRTIVASGLFIAVAFLIVYKYFPEYWPLSFTNVPRYTGLPLSALGCLAIAIGFDSFCARVARRHEQRGWHTALLWPAVAVLAIPVVAASVFMVEWTASPHAAGAINWEALRASAYCTVTPLVGGMAVLAVLAWVSRRRPIGETQAAWTALALILADCDLIATQPLPLSLVYYWRVAAYVLLVAAALAPLWGRIRLGLALLVAAAVAHVGLSIAIGQMSSTNPDALRNKSLFYDTLRSAIEENGLRQRILPIYPVVNVPENSAYGIPVFANYLPLSPAPVVSLVADALRPRFFDDKYLAFYNWEGLAGDDNGNAGLVGWSEYLKGRRMLDAIGVGLVADTSDGLVARRMPDEAAAAALGFDRREVSVPQIGAPARTLVLFKSRTALPRVYFAPSYEAVPYTNDGWAARQWLAANLGRLPRTVVIEASDGFPPKKQWTLRPVASLSGGDPGRAVAPVSTLADTDGYFRFSFDASGPGILVVNDSYHPAWRAVGNGTDLAVVRANAIGTGVVIPSAGHWDVAMTFAPDRGLAPVAACAGLLLLVGAFVVMGRRPGPSQPRDYLVLAAVLPVLAFPTLLGGYLAQSQDDLATRACPLAATRAGDEIDLRWCGRSSSRYTVAVAVGNGPFTRLARIRGASAYALHSADPGSAYRFQVREGFFWPREVTVPAGARPPG